jgi:hypothetical protein
MYTLRTKTNEGRRTPAEFSCCVRCQPKQTYGSLAFEPFRYQSSTSEELRVQCGQGLVRRFADHLCSLAISSNNFTFFSHFLPFSGQTILQKYHSQNTEEWNVHGNRNIHYTNYIQRKRTPQRKSANCLVASHRRASKELDLKGSDDGVQYSESLSFWTLSTVRNSK